MDYKKANAFEFAYTRKLAEVVSATIHADRCQEATAAAIAALANCLVLITHNCMVDKEMVLDAISAAVNRAYRHKDVMCQSLNLQFEHIPPEEEDNET